MGFFYIVRKVEDTKVSSEEVQTMPTEKEQKRQTIVDRTLHKNTKDWVARNPH